MPERNVYAAPFTVQRPEAVSQTCLAHMDRCSYSAALYLETKGGPQTPALSRGEMFHDFAEKATQMLMEQGEPRMPAEVGKELMQSLIEERTDLVLPASEQDACRLMAWNWASATYLDLEAVIAVEQMFELELDGWIVRGRIDRAERVDSQITVRDLKTSLAVPSQEAFAGQWQLPFYTLLIAEGVPEGETVCLGKGATDFRLINEFPRFQTAEGPLVFRETFLDRAKLHDFKRTVSAGLAKLERGIETGEWAASPGTHCSICPASALCPIPREERNEALIGTAGDATEVAERILLAEESLKADKTSLKAWVDENGIVRVGDLEFGFTFSESERANKDAIKQFIREHGADPEDFFKTSPSTRFGKSKAA